MEHKFSVRDSVAGKELVCANCGKSFPLASGVTGADIECLVAPPPPPAPPSQHNLSMIYETDTCVTFICSICSATAAFCKPGLGEPCVSGKPGAWTPPENVEQWLGECHAST